MRRLFNFIYNYRAFFVFLVFEGLSSFLIIQNQNYHKAAFLNSSNVLVGSIVTATTDVSDYFALTDQNKVLAEEVAQLNAKIELLEAQLDPGESGLISQDSLYQFMPANVVNNSFRQLNNYLTLNKGRLDGVQPNQGVLSLDGIVGKIRSVSDRFSIVVSVLHTEFLVSSVLKRSGTLCTTNWDGRNPGYANLIYVPRHVFVNQGDTVTTSGYNSIFPPNQPIGVVDEVSTSPNATFHEIRIKLATDFSSLNYVSVINHLLATEKDSLEQNAGLLN